MLGTLFLGATAQLQQYDRLVLAILCETEPLLIGEEGNKLWILSVGKWLTTDAVAIFKLNDSYCITVRNIASLVSIFLQLLLSVFLVDMSL